ncbi:hypothetical protein A2673_01675 [Candidatus Kaiserbacteria bacterium RIFCSPHIGHO2_01_FULL_50_13]|uniref:D-lactate dehydrogenase (cytochrome) n=1 Tax=Candidatus Kaiserbacteria bacterium RIFCSPLOWO2_01_FULL_50_24 TaxID=1798507 RepID=A0A1F6EMG9_9BACT|nr:MAG: hypothetical protein A2673_01675 [Candidatus Kaiserbacteria bacterium RIFCSPHIGHO2_01_FULL_50_13]OGG74830.1 MAG: hypothetical protein A3A34_00375 [Candidatus Kaiserbacteria bacterium RIFCSPLOWO2_01_FULL_50_24]OGG81413.1 MAG: hypothetical protein A3H74_03160 [Candidatus Kaiserbacteria bacterium RIFCSPLOWO2_02_FULL_51_13]
MSLRDEIAPLIQGDAVDDAETLKKYSRDTSIFEVRPEVVVFPKNARDVSVIVTFVRAEKEKGRDISLTPRAAGTDMSGGPLTRSVSLVFTKYMNVLVSVDAEHLEATAEPGMYYHDFERETLEKTGGILPPYPASREICALGGMIADNAGGELTLKYGKMDRYVKELSVVLSDGSEATFAPISMQELAEKKLLQNLEGEIYRNIHALAEANKEEVGAARPSVSKNSAGYALWDVVNEKNGTFDITKLIVGSQGTLGIITKARFELVRMKPHRAMLVIFLSDLAILPEVVRRVLKFDPEAFESYDDHTFTLAVRFGWQFLEHLGLWKALALGFAFLPEVWMTLTHGVPKLVLIAEFSEDSLEAARHKARDAYAEIRGLPVTARLAFGKAESEKYWKIRRESFALLRKNMKGLHAAPFVDDIVVHPEDYPRFLPELSELLSHYNITYTIAGHIGNGNFHIIPLINLSRSEHRKAVLELTPRMYELVAKYKGSITGEHNDGIIRTPYLSLMFSPKMLVLFAEVKKIFDPLNIFNPGKKVGGTFEDIKRLMMHPAESETT